MFLCRYQPLYFGFWWRFVTSAAWRAARSCGIRLACVFNTEHLKRLYLQLFSIVHRAPGKKLCSTNLQGLLRPGQEVSSRPARTETGTNRWWSLKTWYRSRDPFLGVSVLKFSGLVSVSKFSGLETSNIAEKWFIKISVSQRFFVCYNCRLETGLGLEGYRLDYITATDTLSTWPRCGHQRFQR